MSEIRQSTQREDLLVFSKCTGFVLPRERKSVSWLKSSTNPHMGFSLEQEHVGLGNKDYLFLELLQEATLPWESITTVHTTWNLHFPYTPNGQRFAETKFS